MFKKICAGIAFVYLLAIFVIPQFLPKEKQVFSASLLLSDLCTTETQQRQPLTDEEAVIIRSIIDKPLTFIGKGRHSFAFVSENGQYVMKFFRINPRNHHWYVRFIPNVFPFSQWKWKKERCKLEYVVNAYGQACSIDKEGCGIVYAHLIPTAAKWGNATLIDPDGIRHVVNLDTTLFILQEKVTELRDVVAKYLNQDDVAGAKFVLREVIDLYHKQYQKGIYDWGIGIMHNTGCVGQKPVHFDVSKLVVDRSVRKIENQYRNFNRQVERLDRWLNTHYPEYEKEILEDVEGRLNEIYQCGEGNLVFQSQSRPTEPAAPAN